MFFEIDPELLKQTDLPLYKRWFRNAAAECDLLIWENEFRDIERFQFWHQEALLEWQNKSGIRTGYVDKSSGAFTHYQSDLYRMHQNLDNEIIDYVQNLVEHNKSAEDVLSKIFLILSDISIHLPN
jgi:hypothetical protein